MKAKVFVRVLLFVALGVVTHHVTRALLARDVKKKPSASSATISGPLQPDDVQATIGPLPLMPGSLPVDPSRGFTSVQGVTAEFLGDGFHVSGNASIRDVRPMVGYVWSLRVRDPAKRVFVAESRYDNQVFSVPQDTFELSPTFDDVMKVSLPAGSYNVELVLYEVPPGGVALLDDPAMKRHQIMAKNTVKVRIGG